MEAEETFFFIDAHRQNSQTKPAEVSDETPCTWRRRLKNGALTVPSFRSQANNREITPLNVFNNLPYRQAALIHLLRVRRHGRHAGKSISMRHSFKKPCRSRVKQVPKRMVLKQPPGSHYPMDRNLNMSANRQYHPPGRQPLPGVVIAGDQEWVLSCEVRGSVYAQSLVN
jgi:hypothetical protein